MSGVAPTLTCNRGNFIDRPPSRIPLDTRPQFDAEHRRGYHLDQQPGFHTRFGYYFENYHDIGFRRMECLAMETNGSGTTDTNERPDWRSGPGTGLPSGPLSRISPTTTPNKAPSR